MQRLTWGLVLLAGTLWACSSPTPTRLPYPETRRGDVVDDYHGTKVADPYRWLEDTDSAETKAWVEAQNKVTFGYLEQIEARKRLRQRFTDLWDFEKFGIPKKVGGRYFYTRNDGLQNQSVLYWSPTLDGEPKVLLDPNKLSEDGTVALQGWRISDDGKLMAYGIADAGSDWSEWKVRDVETGKDLEDHLRWMKFPQPAWTPDSKGFFYGRYPAPKEGESLTGANFFHKLYYHRLGTPQEEDIVIHENAGEKTWGFDGNVTEDGTYLIVNVWKGTGPETRVLYKDLREGIADTPLKVLVDDFEAAYTLVGNDGSWLWFFTDLDAPRGRLIGIDLDKPEKESWIEIIPHSKDTLLRVSLVGGKLIAAYLQDAKSAIRVFDTEGKHIGDVDLPGIGTAAGFEGKSHQKETFYSFASFTTPTSIYRYDTTTGKSELFRQPVVDFDPESYEVRQVFYTSKDGTRIPMFLSHRKGMELDGQNPTYLYGYGGFSVPIMPSFSVSLLVWMEMGGLVAIPNLRGGGEYGEEWHLAGTRLNKQNVFDDFIAAAEWLIENRYTSTPRLAIRGSSNGGLLVGACMTQRPDLFGAALPDVGVMDMLRFPKFTIGWAWVDDYGSPDDPEEFQALHAYSPLHNLKEGVRYPTTLITTADHDDRVVPGHSFKFAAALQAAHAGENPVLIRIETRAGHGAGKPTAMIISEVADRYGFLMDALGVEMPAE